MHKKDADEMKRLVIETLQELAPQRTFPTPSAKNGHAEPTRKLEEIDPEELNLPRYDPSQRFPVKTPRQILLNKECGLEHEKPNGVIYKCRERLIAMKVNKVEFIWDNTGRGGQLEYNENDFKFFVVCPACGPSLPESW